MDTTPHQLDPIAPYLGALRTASELPQPYGAVLFAMLTTLTRLHELLHPTSRIEAGCLMLAGANERSGRARPRAVPLPGTTALLFGPDSSGPVSLNLRIEAEALPPFGQNLRLHLLDQESGHGLDHPEKAWSTAVHALLTAARSAEQRHAVLTYAGISSNDRIGALASTRSDTAQLQQVADLIDELTTSAGFASPSSRTSRSEVAEIPTMVAGSPSHG